MCVAGTRTCGVGTFTRGIGTLTLGISTAPAIGDKLNAVAHKARMKTAGRRFRDSAKSHSIIVATPLPGPVPNRGGGFILENPPGLKAPSQSDFSPVNG